MCFVRSLGCVMYNMACASMVNADMYLKAWLAQKADLSAKSSIVFGALSEGFKAGVQPLLHCQHLLTQLSSPRSS